MDSFMVFGRYLAFLSPIALFWAPLRADQVAPVQEQVQRLLSEASVELDANETYESLSRQVLENFAQRKSSSITWNRYNGDVWPNVFYVKLAQGITTEDIAATFFNYSDHTQNPNNSQMGLRISRGTYLGTANGTVSHQVGYRVDLITLLNIQGSALAGFIGLIGSEAEYALTMRLRERRAETQEVSGRYRFDWSLVLPSAKMQRFNGFMEIFNTELGPVVATTNDLQPKFGAFASRFEERPAQFIRQLVNGLVIRTGALKTANASSAEGQLYLNNIRDLRTMLPH